jgi:hypothetical protein
MMVNSVITNGNEIFRILSIKEDEIFVINVGGYIGASTQNEIEYAKSQGKPIRYLENDTFKGLCVGELPTT